MHVLNPRATRTVQVLAILAILVPLTLMPPAQAAQPVKPPPPAAKPVTPPAKPAPVVDPADLPQPAVTRQAVDRQIAALVEQLWKTQNADGHWDELKKPVGKEADGIAAPSYGGTTALVLLSLRVAGQEVEDPRFQKGLKWVLEQDSPGTYFRGLRATLLYNLGDDHLKKALFDDAKFLLTGVQGVSGMYSYVPPPDQIKASSGDFSNTQYGVLGIWAAADQGFEVPIKFWQLLEKTYLSAQCRDDGWAYGPGEKGATGSMTAAALATLFVIWEKEYLAYSDANCRAKVNKDLLKAIDSGLDWMGKNFAAYHTPKLGYDTTYHYYLYGLERVGVASGVKYFDKHDWYKECAAAVLSGKVRPGNSCTEAWTLMFLAYGRAPVAFNKLKYGHSGEWNDRPREFAGLCRYLHRTYEKHFNWQIMPLDAANPADFHDAPILAISGSVSFNFTPAQVEKVKTYLLQGGLLFGQAIENSAGFCASFKALCRQMFPSMEVVRLSANHPIYTCHAQLANGQPELMGISDGVRTLAVLAPKEISCDWQRLNFLSGRRNFELGDNLVQYASDHNQLWSKEESYWPVDQGTKAAPATTITVGRVIHGDVRAQSVWNPTGGMGWQRLDVIRRNGGGPGVATTAVDLSQPVDIRRTPVLHLTGTGSIALSDQAKKNLKAFVDGGGLLLADAAGGKQAFVDSFTKLTADLFGPGGQPLVSAPKDDRPFAASLGEDGNVWFRHWKGLPRAQRPLEIQGVKVKGPDGAGPARWGVLFLPYDMTYALVGNPAYDPIGLDPASAEKVAMAILNWATRPPAPTTAPAGEVAGH